MAFSYSFQSNDYDFLQYFYLFLFLLAHIIKNQNIPFQSSSDVKIKNLRKFNLFCFFTQPASDFYFLWSFIYLLFYFIIHLFRGFMSHFSLMPLHYLFVRNHRCNVPLTNGEFVSVKPILSIPWGTISATRNMQVRIHAHAYTLWQAS